VFSALSETLLHLWSRSADDNDIVDSDTKKKTVEDKAVFSRPSVHNLKLRKHKLSCGNGRTQPIALPSPLTQSENNIIILSGNYKRRLSCNSAVVGSVMLRAEGRGSTDTCNSVFIPGIFFVCGGGGIPSFKKLAISPPPQTAAKLCALNLFPNQTMNYSYITETCF